MDFEYKKQNLMEALNRRKTKPTTVKTKGRFIENIAQAPPTNYTRDMNWFKKANPVASEMQANYYARDHHMLEKRRFDKVRAAINLER